MKNKNINHPFPLQIFVFGNEKKLGLKIAKKLKINGSQFTVRFFPDGETLPHQCETVRGRDVFIIFTSQNGKDTNSNLYMFQQFVWSVKAGDPYKITVIIPKLPHQRQDVENRELRQTTMSNFFPTMLHAAGADHIVVCRLHNPASRTKTPPMENVDTTKLIIEHIRSKYPNVDTLAIGAGDMGGSKYARKVAEEMQAPLIITDKDRNPRTGETKMMKVYVEGEVSNDITSIFWVDDLISTFGTLRKAADAVHNEYPHIENHHAAATHADFGDDTLENIVKSRFQSICVTDTVPVSDKFVSDVKGFSKTIEFISVATYLAQTIDNLHNGRSVSELWVQNGNGHQKQAPQTS